MMTSRHYSWNNTNVLGDMEMQTGYPVMMVVVVVMVTNRRQSAGMLRTDCDMFAACCMNELHRNNEMIQWFAKYFL